MRSLTFWAVSLVVVGTIAGAGPVDAGETVGVYVGTYTGAGTESRGIYRFEFDTETGATSGLRLVAETASPSFLAFAPDGKHLYAVNEVDTFQDKPSGSVSAFTVDPASGKLALINQQPSMGGGPCHLVVDKGGKNVLVSNYGGGSTAVLPIAPGGGLERPSSFVQHQGSSADPGRQKGPHAHSVNLDATGRFAVVADLGLDKVLVYQFDPLTGTIAPNDPPFAALPPKSGPRHFAFHPGGRFGYVINEMDSTVTAWSYDADKGRLVDLQTISTLPSQFRGTNYPADVQVHPSGKFVYGSNRGHNSIVVYTIDQATGRLAYVENQGEGIKNPRNFAIDPAGKFLLVANQDANTVVVFRIDETSGTLKPTGHSIKAPRPVCLKFVPAGK
jgi:6-phosphogluconolactonase